jgi:hypothetical protein
LRLPGCPELEQIEWVITALNVKKKNELREDCSPPLPVAVEVEVALEALSVAFAVEVALEAPSVAVDAGVTLGTPVDGEMALEALLANVELEAPF